MNVRFLICNNDVKSYVSVILVGYQNKKSGVMVATAAHAQVVREKSVHIHNNRANVAKCSVLVNVDEKDCKYASFSVGLNICKRGSGKEWHLSVG